MRVPPKWVRRVVLAPAVVVLTAVVIGLEPLWLLVALLLTSLVPGRFRLPRVVFLVTFYLLWEAFLVVILFVLWIASGFGWKLRTPRFVHVHYLVGAVALRVLFRVFGGVLRLQIVVEGADQPETVDAGVPQVDGRATDAEARRTFETLLAPGVPLVVASRHGGPGDSFILVHTLLNRVGREPRIVLKDTLQWDPAIDILLSRLPMSFITPTGFGATAGGGGQGVEHQIAALAGDLDADDALVIFPEGGQVSASRRRSRVERFRHRGRDDLAERAERLQHVMPPQPGGVFAAVSAAPRPDMVFIGHTGLDRLRSLRDIWRELPMDKRLTMRAWRVPHEEIPAGRTEQAEWLFAWFEHIDRWIAQQTPVDAAEGPAGAHR